MASNAKFDIARKRVVTPVGRLAFPSLFEPKAFENNEPRFSAIVIFPGNTDLKKVAQDSKVSFWDAYLAGMEEKFGTDPKKWPVKHNKPFRPGEEKGDFEGFPGNIFVTVTAKADNPPGVWRGDKSAILDPKEVYAGCYVRCELIASGYDQMGNKGVKFTLMNVQKVMDGKPFSSRRDGSVFSDVTEVDVQRFGEDDDAATGGDDDDDDSDSMFS